MAEESPLLKYVEIAGRGRGLVTARAVKAGQTLLRESPSLIYVSSTGALTFCSTCLRSCTSPPCPACKSATFCSPACSSSHSKNICTALSHLVDAGFDSDEEDKARFLFSAYELAALSPAKFEGLMTLEGEAGEAEKVDGDVKRLHSFVEGEVRDWDWKEGKRESLDLNEMASLLVKEARNGFGVMAPSEALGQRAVRGFAIFLTASFINHDCLPNACRFDDFDATGSLNMEIFIRAMHAIEENVEVTMSYFPINWPLKERQMRLEEEYGFKCGCERCKTEENWSDDEEGEEENEDDEGNEKQNDDAVDESEDEADVAEEEDDFKHAMFFVKYLCPVEECGGTMAPLSADAAVEGTERVTSELEKELFLTMECNMCGHVRSGDEFCKDLQEHGMLGLVVDPVSGGLSLRK